MNMNMNNLSSEVSRLNGALEVLNLLHEKLMLQRDESNTEAGREELNEILAEIESMLREYRKRLDNLHPHHQSYQFIITDEAIVPLRHTDYVDLVSGKKPIPEFSGQTVRLADWYLRLQNAVPQQLVNETYSWLVFDKAGYAQHHAAKAIKKSALPAEKEREQINQQLFHANN